MASLSDETRHISLGCFFTAPFGWCERFRGTDLRPISKPTTNPAKHPQGARRIRKAAKPPTAAQRIAVGKEEQRNECALSF